MNKQKWLILLVALALIGGTGGALGFLRKHQKLGQPGVKWSPIAGASRLGLYLPERVLNYDSEIIQTDTNLLNGLPHDTSFIARVYQDPDTNWVQMRIVLMGTDRTSIHKPELCLTGVGFNIEQQEYETIHVAGARPFDLEVRKLTATREAKIKDRNVVYRGIYYYWFVAENDLTASHWTRMTKTASHLLTTGELQRWAYVSCFVVCMPGGEEAASERVRKFIAAAVPGFQLVAGASGPGPQVERTAAPPDAH